MVTAMRLTRVVICICVVMSITPSCEPVMVSFGTKGGPIVPRETSTTVSPRPLEPRSPAPVSESTQGDLPSSTYKPLVPHQYRSKIYSYTPHPNLLFGTPLDQKYTPSLQKYVPSAQKYQLYKKQQEKARSLGIAYNGPQFFEKQPYEYDLYANRRTTVLQPSVQYIKSQYFPVEKRDGRVMYVPQIGIVYSAGLRYYVPQISHYPQQVAGRDENSVYDRHDEKYFQYK